MLRCDKFVSPKCIYMTTNNYPSHASQTHFFALENIRICTRRRFPVCVRARMLFLSQEHLTMTFLLCRVPCVDTERERERERERLNPSSCLSRSLGPSDTDTKYSFWHTRERTHLFRHSMHQPRPPQPARVYAFRSKSRPHCDTFRSNRHSASWWTSCSHAVYCMTRVSCRSLT